MSRHKPLHRQFARGALRRGQAFLKHHPRLQRYVLEIIRRLGLYSLMRDIYVRATHDSSRSNTGNPHGFIPTDIAHLSPRARQIYSDLKAAVERHRKENG